jgi:hypothetical protein
MGWRSADRRTAAIYLRIARPTLSISRHYLSTIERPHLIVLGSASIESSRLRPSNCRRDEAQGQSNCRARNRVGKGRHWSVQPATATMTRFRYPRRRPVQVKLCARCPYSPRDLADHYDIDAALHLCATCDAEYDPCQTLRRPTCRTRVSNAINKTGPTGRHAVPSARESSASFVITAVARPSVQSGASSVSSSAGTATAAGYGDFELPEHRSRDQSASC